MDRPIKEFIALWNFTRSETLEILSFLDDSKLQFKPDGDKWQSLYHQFGCIGRTQMVYTKAISQGNLDFSMFGSKDLPNKDDFKTTKQLLKFLNKTNTEWLKIIKDRGKLKDYSVKWPGFKYSLLAMITTLISHERLHQGQFIAYFTLADYELPTKFKKNWAL